jgi:hypothetical protein
VRCSRAWWRCSRPWRCTHGEMPPWESPR